MTNGWSVKKLHREILLSKPMPQATGPNPDADPDNKLLSHFDLQHRLEMETLRDSVLAVSGQARPQSSVAPQADCRLTTTAGRCI